MGAEIRDQNVGVAVGSHDRWGDLLQPRDRTGECIDVLACQLADIGVVTDLPQVDHPHLRLHISGGHLALPGLVAPGTELANGFVNRFLIVAVTRSQELPFGGRLQGEQLKRVRDMTLTALRFASLPRQLTFDPNARERWIEVYGPLSRGEEGLLGAATRRAEAHVVRLAAIYATLDTSEQIGLTHLEAALAVWRYSLDSARWIFGDTLGDQTADEIWALAKDRPHGVTRSEVRDLFSRNKKAREIDRALTVLEEAGRLTRTSSADGRGRPAEIWRPQAA